MRIRIAPIVAVVALVSAGCAASGGPTLRAVQPSAPPAATASSVTTPGVGQPAAPSAFAARTWGLVLGARTVSGYSVEAIDGWSGGEFILRTGEPVIGLSVWDVRQVPTDPCHWKGSLRDPGPTLDGLVSALSAQASRTATAPAAATIDGHRGQHLTLHVPADAVVSGDSEFSACDEMDGHHEFVSWLDAGNGERYEQLAGQTDDVWVLDVGGTRLVVDATHSPDSPVEHVAEFLRLVETLHFEKS
jgi:hypothetical protein